MSSLVLSLEAPSDGGLRVRAAFEGRELESRVPFPRSTAQELLEQVESGDAPAAAWRSLSELLGGLLFPPALFGLLKDALAVAEPQLIIQGASELQRWPWELAAEPVSGRPPALLGVSVVRAFGPSGRGRAGAGRGVLVVPPGDAARLEALRAATRPLARRVGLDVFPADPATGPGLRRLLNGGALFVHLDAVMDDGRVQLEDGLVPAERLGVGEDTWLALLGGSGLMAALALRQAGVELVVARQFPVKPMEAATIDRELYRALASGASVAEAVARVRRALASRGSDAQAAWAAPVLVVASGAGAQGPFPPEGLAASPTLLLGTRTVAAKPEATYPDLAGRLNHPLAAPVFIHETIRALRQGCEPKEREARAQALHALGGHATLEPAEAEDLSPDERTTRLTDKLVDAICRPDGPLDAPTELRARVSRIAFQSAVSVESVESALTALRSSRAVWLLAGRDDGAERLIRGLCLDGFGFYPRVLAAPCPDLIKPPAREGDGGGWLARTVATNWRRDELDLYHPEHRPPESRIPLVYRTADGRFELQRGAWLAIIEAYRLMPDGREALWSAVERGVVEGLAEGAPWRVPLPADFRLILAGRTLPPDLPAWIPVVPIHPPIDATVERDRWLAETERMLGAAKEPKAQAERLLRAELITRAVRIARAVAYVPTVVGAAALSYAVAHRGDTATAVDEALTLILSPRFAEASPGFTELFVAWLKRAGDPATPTPRLPTEEEAKSSAALARLTRVIEEDGGDDPALLATLDELLLAPDKIRAPSLWSLFQRLPALSVSLPRLERALKPFLKP